MRSIHARALKLALLGGAACVGLGSGAAHAQANVAAAPTNSASQLETVVVTARRREEKSQDVPISITSFSGARLRQQNISEAQDLQASVPSLVVGQNGQGVRDASTFTLRGQGTTFEGSSGVATYLNEVPLPTPVTLSNQGGPGNFLDLSNVQVLAGPQGTLFGRNTTGGAVLLVPQRPTDRFEGYIQGSYGNYNDRELEGVINVPIIPDVLKARLAVQTKDRDGYTHDVYQNVWHDDTHYATARLGIDWSPTGDFDSYTMAYYTNSHNHGPGSINEGYNVPGLVAANAFEWNVGLPAYGVPPGVIGCSPGAGPTSCTAASAYYTGLANQAKQLGPRADALDVHEYDYIHTWGVTNTTKLQITPNTAVRNIASYAEYRDGYSIDEDGSTAPQYDTGYNGFGANAASSAFPRDAFSTATEELQLQGTQLNDNLNYTLGGFYFASEPTGAPQVGSAVDSCSFNLVAFAMLAGGNTQTYCSPFVSQFKETNRSEALYGQGTYNLGQLTPVLRGLKLTLGYRYTWDQITGSSTYNGGFTGRLRSSAPTWTVGLDYKLWEGMLAYGKVSRGYKAGGVNTYAVYTDTETFGPEYNTTYEVGLKSDTHILDRPVRFNLSLYRTIYDKIQRAAGDTNPAGVQGAVILSSASAVIQGLELEADTKLTRDLEFGLNYGYTDAYYTKFPYTPNQSFFGYTDCNGTPWDAHTTLNLACRPLQYIAPNIFSAHLTYNLPIDPSLGKISAFLSYSYENPQHTEALFGSQQPFELLKSYQLLNLTVDWRNMFGRPIDASFFATNLTDTLYRTTNTDTWESENTASTLYGEPRMFGFRLKYHWGD